ncbi:MAG: hypothetical protein R3D71_10490 [Rickettsiales bacterium]
MKQYILLTSRRWHEKTVRNLGKNFFLINRKEDFTYENVKKINPDYIFIPHWSHTIQENIHKNFNCIIFHMTDLPYGRGGSPLQNLIIREHKTTKISAIKCEKEVDSGDVYLKHDLDLSGTAQEIFARSADIIEKMIKQIIDEAPLPTPQKGEIVKFTRRKPKESDISNLSSLDKIYDYIRMLDADGYPKAFIELENGIKLEFNNPEYKDGKLTATVSFNKQQNP